MKTTFAALIAVLALAATSAIAHDKKDVTVEKETVTTTEETHTTDGHTDPVVVTPAK